MRVVRIQLRSIPGGWRASVGDPAQRPAETDLSDARLAAVVTTVDTLLTPPLVGGTDVRRSRAEEEAGSQLASLLAAPQTTAALHQQLGEARGRAEPVLLLIDAPEAPARRLPWELIGQESPLEERDAVVVARLVEGPRPQTATHDAFRVVIVSDTTDPLCRARVAELEIALAQRGIPTAAGPEATVVHVVAHGAVADAEAHLIGAGGDQSAGTAAHALNPLLNDAALVVLDVCDAGNTTSEERAVPGPRLVRAGGRAVVAPVTRLGVEAATAFSQGLYDGLADGESVATAVARGRRAIRVLGLPHPDSRWNNPVLHLAGAGAASQILRASGWRPDGWGRLHTDVRALCRAARDAAEPHGFVGIEHLLAAWPDTGGGPWAAHLRYALAHQSNPLRRLGALQPRSDRDPDWRGTARLRGIDIAHADLEQLAQRMWSALDNMVQALFGLGEVTPQDLEMSGATLEPPGTTPANPDVSALEVLGGPEDGRRFGPGSRIGRASGVVDGLYRDTRLVDPYLSRQALAWDPTPTLVKPAKVRVDGQWVDRTTGPLGLVVGDQVALTSGTVVRAR